MSPALASAGYSGTPLAQKLGLKDGQSALFLDLPDTLAELATARDFAAVEQSRWERLATARDFDYIHGFTTSRRVLEAGAKPLAAAIRPNGTVWVSWPKKASKLATDVDENVLRELLLPTGLVDVKVAAIDAIWSGLKFMVRRELR